ncbi:MAG: hypothetical protein ACYTXA_31950 [Nostoc sp.]
MTSTISLAGFASSATAQNQSSFEEALQRNNYPTAKGNSFICYAETNTPNTFDLSRLCGSVPAPLSVNSPSASVPAPLLVNSPSASVERNTSSGPCNVPDDIARDGSRCGGRAASVRPGGK